MKTSKRTPPAPKHTIQGARVLGRICGRPAVFYYSRKADGILALESAGERTIAQLAELDPRVKSISAQPFALDIVTGKIFKTRSELEAARKTRPQADALRRDYTPDLLLTLFDGDRIIVEAKDTRHPLSAQYQEKLDIARHLFAMRGERFALIPLRYEESAPLIQNIELLSRTLGETVDADLLAHVTTKVATLLKNDAIPLGKLMSMLEMSLRAAPNLITAGVLSAQLDRSPLCSRTLVRAAHGSLNHLEILPLETRP